MVLTWLPHFKPLPQAVANSFCEWMNARAQAGHIEFVVTHPEGYELAPEFVGDAPVITIRAKHLPVPILFMAKTGRPTRSMGRCLRRTPSWAVTMDDLNLTNNGKFMHCLPVRRNLKVSDAVLDSPQSLVIEQAANREWSAQAVLKEILTNLVDIGNRTYKIAILVIYESLFVCFTKT